MSALFKHLTGSALRPRADASRAGGHSLGWLGPLPFFPWQRRHDPTADHGHDPFGAWEAELSAYARLRTGMAIKVTFGLGTAAGWGDEIQLARPDGHRPRTEAFAAAERDLEHWLMHHRHGREESVLLWHTWSYPTEPVRLPWSPWDRAGLSPAVIRDALAAAVPELSLPPNRSLWPARQRDAARWVAAAWADRAHRTLEVRARPGLAERLAGPPEAPPRSLWEAVLVAIADGQLEERLIPIDVRTAVEGLVGADYGEVTGHVARVLDLVELLSQKKAVPPSHKQRPAWLRPPWGRWHHEMALRRAVDALVRTPYSTAMAAAAAAGRGRRSGAPSLNAGSGGLAAILPPGGRTRNATEPHTDDPTIRGPDGADGAAAPDKRNEWGLAAAEPPGSKRSAGGADAKATGSDSQGAGGGGAVGAGAGTLGALHVIVAGPEDRSAYWQLRAALTPEIERLVERLQAMGDQYYASAPRRFQRAGRLDRNRFPASLSGRETVFTRFVHKPEPAHAFCLLLDCSASMTTHAQRLREVAILLESASAAIGAKVTAFTFGAAWERMEPPAAGAPLVALGRELHPRGGTPFGPALEAAASWLSQQPYPDKRLWVFSDGQWNARDRVDVAWRADVLRDAVVWVLGDEAPPPPSKAMQIVAAPSLADLVQLAPGYFWRESQRRSLATTHNG